jgi:glycosyltransferase involved in cell wall biosynthesis
VVDDHSTDNSWDLLQSWRDQYPETIRIFNNPVKGANHARNHAFEQSTGQYIQWLDSDDRLLPGKFDRQIVPLQNGEADIVYSDWQMDFWVEGQMTRSEQMIYQDYPDYLEELIKENWNVSHSYLMTRAMALKLSGNIGWNPETKVGQDREYFTMTGILGARFKYVQGVFAVYNSQDKGTIAGIAFDKRLIENQKLEKRIFNEIQASPNIPTLKKKVYSSILYTHKIKACFYLNEIPIDEPFSLFELRWDLIHYKMRLPIIFLYFIKHIQYFLKK